MENQDNESCDLPPKDKLIHIDSDHEQPERANDTIQSTSIQISMEMKDASDNAQSMRQYVLILRTFSAKMPTIQFEIAQIFIQKQSFQ
jgi:hypothetical protein